MQRYRFEITTKNTVEDATVGLKSIADNVGIKNPIIQGIAIPRYTETVIKLGGTLEDALNGIASIADVGTNENMVESSETNAELNDTNILPKRQSLFQTNLWQRI